MIAPPELQGAGFEDEMDLAEPVAPAIVDVISFGASVLPRPATAHADDQTVRSVDKSVYSLLNPTPDKDLRDFDPDRPTKITSPFTIDAGRLDIESDLVSYQHSDVKGVTYRSFQVSRSDDQARRALKRRRRDDAEWRRVRPPGARHRAASKAKT